MEVVAFGKRSPNDLNMTIDLKFTLLNDPIPKVVGNYFCCSTLES